MIAPSSPGSERARAFRRKGRRSLSRDNTCLILPLDVVCWQVAVTTGDIFGAGTDNAIWVELRGSAGVMGFTRLPEKNRDCFERGKTDRFTISGKDVGDVDVIGVRSDPTGIWSIQACPESRSCRA